LWKVKSKGYSDRVKKNLAYKHLTTKVKEIDPDANKEKVAKKINSLRSCFRKELRKVNDSKTPGAGADDTYTPCLWYFQEMLFLTEQEVPREGKYIAQELETLLKDMEMYCQRVINEAIFEAQMGSFYRTSRVVTVPLYSIPSQQLTGQPTTFHFSTVESSAGQFFAHFQE
jgi:hypothetical protein